MPQPASHFARQADVVIINEKKNSSAPAIIAPSTLVATNSIAKSITDVKIVPKIPVSKTGSIEHTQLRTPLPQIEADDIRVIARYKIAIPNTTHKNTGVMVITAVIVKNAVIIPIIILATIAIPVQSLLQLHVRLDIYYSPPI